MEESQRDERAGGLPPRLPELLRRTGKGWEKRPGQGGGTEGSRGRSEVSKEGSLQARKEGKNTAARIQRDHKPYASRQQKERERGRERERASSPRSRARQPPDLPQTPPKHCLVLSAQAAPLTVLLPLLHLLLKNQNNTREGGKSLPKPADSLRQQESNNKYIKIYILEWERHGTNLRHLF